jgi:hypothetical protein
MAMAALSGPRLGQRVIAMMANAIGASIAAENNIASNSVMAPVAALVLALVLASRDR